MGVLMFFIFSMRFLGRLAVTFDDRPNSGSLEARKQHDAKTDTSHIYYCFVGKF